MRHVVRGLHRRCQHADTTDERMRLYLSSRHIICARVVEDIRADGALEPLGAMYTHGFNILLRRQHGRRRRFTLAHEICHTFFYESAPELKFTQRAPDPTEESLCDLGAAELLMPTTTVQREAMPLPVCIESLSLLAARFAVSVSAMFIRLHSMGLWKCVLSEWTRTTNGNFALSRIYGGKRVPWEWADESAPRKAWYTLKPSFGNTLSQ